MGEDWECGGHGMFWAISWDVMGPWAYSGIFKMGLESPSSVGADASGFSPEIDCQKSKNRSPPLRLQSHRDHPFFSRVFGARLLLMTSPSSLTPQLFFLLSAEFRKFESRSRLIPNQECVLLGKIGDWAGDWYTIYHLLPVVIEG